jgi:hypothetical protein
LGVSFALIEEKRVEIGPGLGVLPVQAWWIWLIWDGSTIGKVVLVVESFAVMPV